MRWWQKLSTFAVVTLVSSGFPSFCYKALQWRHNGHDSVSNHRLFRRRSKETSKLRVTGLCAGNLPGTGEFPAQMTSNAENVSIWWRHHGKLNIFSSPNCLTVQVITYETQLIMVWESKGSYVQQSFSIGYMHCYYKLVIAAFPSKSKVNKVRCEQGGKESDNVAIIPTDRCLLWPTAEWQIDVFCQ